MRPLPSVTPSSSARRRRVFDEIPGGDQDSDHETLPSLLLARTLA